MEYATKKRWIELVEFLGGSHQCATAWFQRLVKCMTEPHRKYHTPFHLEECLEELDEIDGDEERLALIEVAIWFHDAVYQPGSADNEQKSAEMAKEFMLECEASPSVIEFVSDMIMATKDHRSNDDEDAAIMVALDLNILARDQKRYAEYESQIREEYASVPLEVYCEKRIEILQGFLARPVIYESETMAEIYEEQARMNLAWSVKRLQSELQVE